MKLILTLIFLLNLSFVVFSQVPQLATGQWKVYLQLNDSIRLPFQLNIKKTPQNQYEFTILNASETIQFDKYSIKKDSLFLVHSIFDSQFELQLIDSISFNGLWRNQAKGKNYTLLVIGYKSTENRFTTVSDKKPFLFNGNYETLFTDKEEGFPATGVFYQNHNKITGTFLTETGDFRFLEGNVAGNRLFLSCFDGSHAFYFDGTMVKDTIKGHFFSGSHYQASWVAFKNDQFKLKHSDSITHVIKTSDIRFSLPDLDSIIFHYPNENYKSKVTLIQIMGSWCPNCLDETRLFKELYKTYHKDGLEIISIAFEVHKDFKEKVAAVTKLKKNIGIPYKILLAKNSKKASASSLFPSLNNISSFPTVIYMDKNNRIRRIHTGFSGPGTGSIYKRYVKEISLFIEKLLKE